ncbi:hypothetical protein EMCG_04544 [[Emmonsia] crescens]|uniref:Uncharacterized protein n=1 Tax=[Emmonsia] crescens TaxID=73230 RepID=A0A0G2HST1_9EURO|nr:hypothetical protein EMCG_04544 [Emmonsia crescens UAMH 3008]
MIFPTSHLYQEHKDSNTRTRKHSADVSKDKSQLRMLLNMHEVSYDSSEKREALVHHVKLNVLLYYQNLDQDSKNALRSILAWLGISYNREDKHAELVKKIFPRDIDLTEPFPSQTITKPILASILSRNNVRYDRRSNMNVLIKLVKKEVISNSAQILKNLVKLKLKKN